MWILIAEALLALALLLAIVWWTMGPTHRRERQEARKEPVGSESLDADRDGAGRSENK